MISTLRRTSSAASSGTDRASPPHIGTRWRCSVLLCSQARAEPSRIASERVDSVAGSPSTIDTLSAGFSSAAAPRRTSKAQRAWRKEQGPLFFSSFIFSLPRSTRHSTLDTRPFSLDSLRTSFRALSITRSRDKGTCDLHGGRPQGCYAAPDSSDDPLRTSTILPVTPPFPSNSCACLASARGNRCAMSGLIFCC